MKSPRCTTLQFNEHIEDDGATVFKQGKLGLEGIVSKRKGSPTSQACPYRKPKMADWRPRIG